MTLKNKIWTLLYSALLILVLSTGCTGKSEKADSSDESMTLSANDTAKVVDLMHQYFDLLINQDYSGAMSMLHQFQNDSLFEMTPEVKQHYELGMKMIVPVRYELETMVFNTESDCLVKYSAVLFDKEGDSDNRPNKMSYTVRPVRLNGEWFLTVSDKKDMNTRDSKIEL